MSFEWWDGESTSIQATFHPDHQEVECHERDFPRCEEMTEASAENFSEKDSFEESTSQALALFDFWVRKMVSEKIDKETRVDVCW